MQISVNAKRTLSLRDLVICPEIGWPKDAIGAWSLRPVETSVHSPGWQDVIPCCHRRPDIDRILEPVLKMIGDSASAEKTRPHVRCIGMVE